MSLLYQFMDKKHSEGSSYKVYMMASANKFLRICYAFITVKVCLLYTSRLGKLPQHDVVYHIHAVGDYALQNHGNRNGQQPFIESFVHFNVFIHKAHVSCLLQSLHIHSVAFQTFCCCFCDIFILRAYLGS